MKSIEVKLHRKLSQENREEIIRKFKELADDYLDVTLDIRLVPFIDSIGLGLIISLHKKLKRKNGNLLLLHPSPRVMSFFQLTNMDRVLNISSELIVAD